MKLKTKSDNALRTIGEVSEMLAVPDHVLRFWEENFTKLKPKKYNGRRYYSAKDIELLEKIKDLLYNQGYSVKAAAIYLKSPLSKIELPSLEDTMQKLIAARDKLTALLN
jgi:DNA-binding transcriptional MerR regulator